MPELLNSCRISTRFSQQPVLEASLARHRNRPSIRIHPGSKVTTDPNGNYIGTTLPQGKGSIVVHEPSKKYGDVDNKNAALAGGIFAQQLVGLLEYVLQCKLHLPHGDASSSDCSKCSRGICVGVRSAPNRMVRGIEQLPTELKPLSFLDAEVLVR